MIYQHFNVVKSLQINQQILSMEIIQKFSTFYTNLASMKIDELSKLYGNNVVFIDPIGSHKGIQAVESYFSRLLKNAKQCEFEIHDIVTASEEHAIVIWTMTYVSNRVNGGKPVEVEGVTRLEMKDNKIVLHRDYFDLGQMVYEQLPILGYAVKAIKRKMRQ